jgi:hypothetical protein
MGFETVTPRGIIEVLIIAWQARAESPHESEYGADEKLAEAELRESSQSGNALPKLGSAQSNRPTLKNSE